MKVRAYEALGSACETLGGTYEALGRTYEALGRTYVAFGGTSEAFGGTYVALGRTYEAFGETYEAIGGTCEALGEHANGINCAPRPKKARQYLKIHYVWRTHLPLALHNMDNNKLNAQLLRDTATAAGLQADKALYAALEADIAPLRDEHAANLALARTLEGAVMAEANDDATQQKASAKTQLKALAPRLAATLQSYAASKTNPDEDLPGRVRYNRTDLAQANDASFASIVGALLREATPRAAELAKREFSADDLALTTRLLARFEQKQTTQRTAAVAGATDRRTLTALLRRNANLIKDLRVQLKPYQSSPAKHEVWLRFQGYTKLIVRGQGGPRSTPAPQPAA
jgi:hypothetical protein